MAVTERIRGRLSTGPITLCGGMMVEQQVNDRGALAERKREC